MINSRFKSGLRELARIKGHWFGWAPDEAADEILGQCSRCAVMWHFRPQALAADLKLGALAIAEGPNCETIRLLRESILDPTDKSPCYFVGVGPHALSHVMSIDSPLRAPVSATASTSASG